MLVSSQLKIFVWCTKITWVWTIFQNMIDFITTNHCTLKLWLLPYCHQPTVLLFVVCCMLFDTNRDQSIACRLLAACSLLTSYFLFFPLSWWLHYKENFIAICFQNWVTHQKNRSLFEEISSSKRVDFCSRNCFYLTFYFLETNGALMLQGCIF